MHVCRKRDCIFRQGGGCIVKVVIEKRKEGMGTTKWIFEERTFQQSQL